MNPGLKPHDVENTPAMRVRERLENPVHLVISHNVITTLHNAAVKLQPVTEGGREDAALQEPGLSPPGARIDMSVNKSAASANQGIVSSIRFRLREFGRLETH